MKLIFKKIALPALLLTIALTGCLKQYDGLPKDINNDSPKPMLEFTGSDYTLVSSSHEAVIALNSTPDKETFLIGHVRLTTPNLTSSPVTIKLKQNNKLVTDAGYTAFPTNSIVIPTEVIIPAGAREVEIKATITKSLLDLSQSYAVALESDNVDYQVNPQGNTLFVNILVKNKYDGRYKLTGTMVDLANSALTGYYPVEVWLVTTGANSVAMYFPDPSYDYFYHPISSAGSLSVYGSFSPEFTFNSSDIITAVTNIYGQPATNTRSGKIDPSGSNKLNSDKSIDIKYFMLQPSVVATPPNIRTTFDEHFEYLGPR